IRDMTDERIITGKIELNYTLAPWAEVMYRVGLYSLDSETRSYTRRFEAQGTRNTNGSVTDGSTAYTRLNSDIILTLRKDLGDWSNRLVLGQNIRSDYRKAVSVGSSQLLYPDVINPGSRTGNLSG